MSLTRSGYMTKDGTKEIKTILTVSPLASADYPRPRPFKVYKERNGYLCIPRYFAKDICSQPPADKRPDPNRADIAFNGVIKPEFRQDEAIKLGIESLCVDGGGVLSLPCGYGKTFCALALASHFKVRTMIVVHKEFLATQWEERIRQFCPGSTIGRVQCDKVDLKHDFVIAMIQSLSQREYELGTFDSIGMLIVDEAHHVCARAFSQFLFKMCPKYTLGLTATPERKDGLTKLLYWFLGPQFLCIERGADNVKVVPMHFNGPFPGVTVTRFGKLSMPEMITDLTLIPERNTLICDKIRELLLTKRNILVLTDRREHAMYILGEFKDVAGLYIGGLTEAQLNDSASKRLIIATFSLAQEGLDIPKLNTVLFVTPKSDIKQAAGRILRGHGDHPIVYDVVDHWTVFNSMFIKRCSLYNQMNFEIEGFEKPVPKPAICLL